MNQEKIKLIIQNIELLVLALKEELSLQESSHHPNIVYDDYDEIFEE